VITVNPRHRDFYVKAMGFLPLGPPKTYSSVQNHPAEGYWSDVKQLRELSPKMAEEIFREGVPGEALVAPKMLPHMIRYLGDQSSQAARKTIREVFDCDQFFASPRRW
jgi:hypothetical protein